MNRLGGSTFVWNGNVQDYCYKETISCLSELADEISVVAGGNDGTFEEVSEHMRKLITEYPNKVFILSMITQEEWDAQQGREKLSYFSNMAIERLTTEWNFYLQCDEIIHENSFQYIRQAIEHDANAFLCRRLNLWGDPLHMLNVPQERKPVSTEVIRLAKTNFRCVDDAENIGVDSCHILGDIDLIQIWHMGFVRDQRKHIHKIKHMQKDVFLMDYDKRADLSEVFDPWQWGFTKEDVVDVPGELPKFIKQWCTDRYPD